MLDDRIHKKEKARKKKKKKKHKKHKKKRKRDDDDASGSGSEEDSRHEEERMKRRLLKKARKYLKDNGVVYDGREKQEKTSNVVRIDESHYFERSREFRTWLQLKKRPIHFEDLTSKEARGLFSRFVTKWNDGVLDEAFYREGGLAELRPIRRTRHNWGFAKNMDKNDRRQLASVKDSIDVQTNSHKRAGKLSSGRSSTALRNKLCAVVPSSRDPSRRPSLLTKEDATMAAFIKANGLDSGRRIKIQPRE